MKSPNLPCNSQEIGDWIQQSGLTALPALIDPHVHFRTPGGEHKENWITAARAAVNGGVTTVIDMPNNNPACTSIEQLKAKHQLIQQQLLQADIPLRYYLYVGADRKHLKEIPKTKELAIGIKVFMGSSTGDLLIDDEPTLDELFRMASDMDMLVSVHAEDEALIRNNKEVHQGRTEPWLHSVIRTKEAAIKATERALSLAAKHGTRLCILHMTTQEEIALLKQAKAAGVSAYGEVSPHHLFLTTQYYTEWGTLVQVNPPLREPDDRAALWKGISEGTIDFIGTDHAPHTLEEKMQPYGKAPSGIPSIDLLLPLLLDAVAQGKLTLQRLIELTRTNIEKIFRLPSNEDVVLVDLSLERPVTDEKLFTKCGWSPYRGRVLQGWPLYTLIHGKIFQNTHAGHADQPEHLCTHK